jgi:hypothetical protein
MSLHFSELRSRCVTVSETKGKNACDFLSLHLHLFLEFLEECKSSKEDDAL